MGLSRDFFEEVMFGGFFIRIYKWFFGFRRGQRQFGIKGQCFLWVEDFRRGMKFNFLIWVSLGWIRGFSFFKIIGRKEFIVGDIWGQQFFTDVLYGVGIFMLVFWRFRVWEVVRGQRGLVVFFLLCGLQVRFVESLGLIFVFRGFVCLQQFGLCWWCFVERFFVFQVFRVFRGGGGGIKIFIFLVVVGIFIFWDVGVLGYQVLVFYLLLFYYVIQVYC